MMENQFPYYYSPYPYSSNPYANMGFGVSTVATSYVVPTTPYPPGIDPSMNGVTAPAQTGMLPQNIQGSHPVTQVPTYSPWQPACTGADTKPLMPGRNSAFNPYVPRGTHEAESGQPSQVSQPTVIPPSVDPRYYVYPDGSYSNPVMGNPTVYYPIPNPNVQTSYQPYPMTSQVEVKPSRMRNVQRQPVSVSHGELTYLVHPDNTVYCAFKPTNRTPGRVEVVEIQDELETRANPAPSSLPSTSAATVPRQAGPKRKQPAATVTMRSPVAPIMGPPGAPAIMKPPTAPVIMGPPAAPVTKPPIAQVTKQDKAVQTTAVSRFAWNRKSKESSPGEKS